MKRKTIECEHQLSGHILSGKIVDVIDELNKIRKEYGDKAYLEVEASTEWNYGYETTELNVSVRYTREETDSEMEDRRKRQAAARKAAKTRNEAKKQRELELLEKLKAKYENTV